MLFFCQLRKCRQSSCVDYTADDVSQQTLLLLKRFQTFSATMHVPRGRKKVFPPRCFVSVNVEASVAWQRPLQSAFRLLCHMMQRYWYSCVALLLLLQHLQVQGECGITLHSPQQPAAVPGRAVVGCAVSPSTSEACCHRVR